MFAKDRLNLFGAAFHEGNRLMSKFILPTSSTKTSKSIKEFCNAHGISRALFFQLRRRGEAPVTVKAGRRRFITQDAELAWLTRFAEGGAQ